MEENLKEKVFKAQRLYYLSLRLGEMIPDALREFSKDNLNRYIKLAKGLDLKLTPEEMYEKLFK